MSNKRGSESNPSSSLTKDSTPPTNAKGSGGDPPKTDRDGSAGDPEYAGFGELADILSNAAGVLRRNDNIDLFEKNKQLKELQQQSQDKIKQKDTEIAEMKENNNKLLEEERAERQKLEGQAKAQKAELERKIEECLTRIDSMETEINEKKASVQTLMKSERRWKLRSMLWMAVARAYARTLEQRQQTYDQGIKKVQEMADLNGKFRAERIAAVNRANDKEAALMMERGELEKQKKPLLRQLRESQTRCSELENEVSSLKTANQTFQKKVQEMEDKIQELQEERDSLEAAAQESEVLTEYYKKEAQTVQMQLEVSDTQKTAATEHMVSMGQQCVTLQMQLAQAESAVKELGQMLEVKNHQVKHLQDLVDQMDTQKSSHEDEMRRTRLHIDNLENKVRIADTTIRTLKETSANTQGELEQNMQTINDNTSTIRQLQDALSQKEQENRRCKQEVERLKQELRTAYKQKARVINGSIHRPDQTI